MPVYSDRDRNLAIPPVQSVWVCALRHRRVPWGGALACLIAAALIDRTIALIAPAIALVGIGFQSGRKLRFGQLNRPRWSLCVWHECEVFYG